jgi:hypothetical protein
LLRDGDLDFLSCEDDRRSERRSIPSERYSASTGFGGKSLHPGNGLSLPGSHPALTIISVQRSTTGISKLLPTFLTASAYSFVFSAVRLSSYPLLWSIICCVLSSTGGLVMRIILGFFRAESVRMILMRLQRKSGSGTH